MDLGIFTCKPTCSIRKMIIKTVEVKDGIRVDEFLNKYMYIDEPLACTIDRNDVPAAGKGFATEFAPQGLSCLAEDEDGHIIGVCLNDKIPQSFPFIYSITESDKKFQDLFDYLQEASHIMKVAPDAMELRVLLVKPEFRNCGVASRLLEESLKNAREAGYSWVKMYCTSFYSSKMLSKKGWTLLYSKSYSDLKDIILDLPVPKDPHTTLDLYIKATSD